jgi:hypothetical protein
VKPLAAFLPLLAFAACGSPRGDAPDHLVLSSIDTLRARFNADSGKVRAVLLGSPT